MELDRETTKVTTWKHERIFEYSLLILSVLASVSMAFLGKGFQGGRPKDVAFFKSSEYKAIIKSMDSVGDLQEHIAREKYDSRRRRFWDIWWRT